MKAVGPARIVMGMGYDGVIHEDEFSCFQKQLRQLNEGVDIELPAAKGTGTERWRLKAWAINFAGDYEARMQVLPFGDGINAHRECHACDREQHGVHAYTPMAFEFVRSSSQRKRSSRSADTVVGFNSGVWQDNRPVAHFNLRKEQQVLKQVDQFRQMTLGERNVLTRATGVAKTVFALSDIPFFEFIKMSTNDLMHIEGSSGNLSHEAAQLFYSHTRVRQYYTFTALCNAIDSFDFPRDHQVDAPLPGVIKGTKDGRPHAGTTTHWSASQTFHFAMHRCMHCLHPPPLLMLVMYHAPLIGTPLALTCSHHTLSLHDLSPFVGSIAIIEPLMPDTAKISDPAWLSWKKHVEYVVLSLSHQFKRGIDLPLLGKLVQEHHKLYQLVPEYGDAGTKCLMKPKNHMATHLGHTISDGGPLRQLW